MACDTEDLFARVFAKYWLLAQGWVENPRGPAKGDENLADGVEPAPSIAAWPTQSMLGGRRERLYSHREPGGLSTKMGPGQRACPKGVCARSVPKLLIRVGKTKLRQRPTDIIELTFPRLRQDTAALLTNRLDQQQHRYHGFGEAHHPW